MKFCIMTHIRYLEHNSYSKSEFLKKNSRWWTRPFNKIGKWDVSAIVSLILIFQFQVIAFIKGWERKKISIFFHLLSQNSEKSANAWNIQTFKISLLWFDKFWWNFARQSILAFPSWRVTTSLIILKSNLIDDGQLENWKKFQFPSILYPETAKKCKWPFSCQTSEIFKRLRYLCRRLTNFD